MFSKSKTKRFEDPPSFAPPVGHYDIKDQKNSKTVRFYKANRWNESRVEEDGVTLSNENLSGSGGFSFSKTPLPTAESTCIKKSRKSCFIAADIHNCQRSLEADMEFQDDGIRILQEQVKKLESEVKKSKENTVDMQKYNEELKASLDDILNEKITMVSENRKLEEQLIELKTKHLQLAESMNKLQLEESRKTENMITLQQFELSVSKIIRRITSKYTNLEMTFDEVQMDFQKRLKRSNSLLEKTVFANKNNILQFHMLQNKCTSMQYDFDFLTAEQKTKQNLIVEQQQKLVEFGENASLLVDQLKSKEEDCESINRKLVAITQEMNEKDKLFTEEKEKLLSMNDNIREIISKYENFEETFDKVQKDYRKRLENANSTLEKNIVSCKKSNKEFENLQNMYTELQHDYGTLTVECETKKILNVEQEKKLFEYKENVKSLKDQLSMLENSNKEVCEHLNKKLDDLNKENKEKQGAFAEEKQDLLKQLSEKKTLVESLPPIYDVKFVELQEKLGEAELTANSWRVKYEDLERKVAPFMDQLNQFEFEKQTLLNQNAFTQQEMKKISEKYGEVLGHQNNKQKIRHISKLKEEHLQLKGEVIKLRADAEKSRLRINQLENKCQTKRFNPANAFTNTKENKREVFKQVNS